MPEMVIKEDSEMFALNCSEIMSSIWKRVEWTAVGVFSADRWRAAYT